MATVALHLDERTYARAQRLAEQRNVSIAEFISEAIDRYAAVPGTEPMPRESMIGLFADVPELMDQIVEEAYRDRERAPHWRKVE